MSLGLAKLLLFVLLVYTCAGIVFAVFFLARGIGRIDPSAAAASLGFRILVTPGVVTLWPILARAWLRGRTVPPQSYTAHDAAAGGRKPL